MARGATSKTDGIFLIALIIREAERKERRRRPRKMHAAALTGHVILEEVAASASNAVHFESQPCL